MFPLNQHNLVREQRIFDRHWSLKFTRWGNYQPPISRRKQRILQQNPAKCCWQPKPSLLTKWFGKAGPAFLELSKTRVSSKASAQIVGLNGGSLLWMTSLLCLFIVMPMVIPQVQTLTFDGAQTMARQVIPCCCSGHIHTAQSRLVDHLLSAFGTRCQITDFLAGLGGKPPSPEASKPQHWFYAYAPKLDPVLSCLIVILHCRESLTVI